MSNIKFKVSSHALSTESINGFLSTFWSVFFVGSFWIIEADESILTHFVFEKDEGFDVSKSLEHFLNLIVSHLKRDVLNVDVVDKLSERSSVFWLEFASNDVIILVGQIDGFLGRFFILEADESISSGGMVTIKRDLEGLNLTNLLEFLLEIGVLFVLWDLADEDVVRHELLFIASEKLLVKLESSTWLLFNLEIFHCFDSFVESNWVFNADDSRVEWSGDVLSDLRLGIKKDTSLLFEGDGDFFGIGLILWKIVQIDQVLLLFSDGVTHLDMFFFFLNLGGFVFV